MGLHEQDTVPGLELPQRGLVVKVQEQCLVNALPQPGRHRFSSAKEYRGQLKVSKSHHELLPTQG